MIIVTVKRTPNQLNLRNSYNYIYIMYFHNYVIAKCSVVDFCEDSSKLDVEMDLIDYWIEITLFFFKHTTPLIAKYMLIE